MDVSAIMDQSACCYAIHDDIENTSMTLVEIWASISVFSVSFYASFIAWLKFLYGQSVRFPASFPCLSFPVPFLYTARTKAVLTGLKAY